VANIKSQIKRNRQNDKKRLRNRVYRGEARIAVRNARTTIDEGLPESKAALLEAISALDKAAEQGVIHKNNAARRKSRLMKAFGKMEPVKGIVEPASADSGIEAAAESPSPKVKKPGARKASVSTPAKGKKVTGQKAEAAAETPAEPKASSRKKVAVKKPAVKKAETKKPQKKAGSTSSSSSKGKKPTASK
jgi:small subunit ribosomal protein S20